MFSAQLVVEMACWAYVQGYKDAAEVISSVAPDPADLTGKMAAAVEAAEAKLQAAQQAGGWDRG